MQLEDVNLVEEQDYVCMKRNGESSEEHGVLLKEHAMDIYTDGEFYTTVVCTEEWLFELVLGRLLCDGMITSMDEVKSLKIAEDHSAVDVEIIQKETWDLSESDFSERLQISYSDEWIFHMADAMAAGMPLHEQTWSTHSCYLVNLGELIFSCEDISRHNAVDKVIGYALKNHVEMSKCAIYTSGRVPANMIDKMIAAGIPVLASKGMPTMQAVELAKAAKVTLICGARRDQIRIYTDYRKK